MWQGGRDGLRAALAGGAGWRRRRLRGRVGTAKGDVSGPSWNLSSAAGSSSAVTTSSGLRSTPGGSRGTALDPRSEGEKREHLVTALALSLKPRLDSQSVVRPSARLARQRRQAAVGSSRPSVLRLPPRRRHSAPPRCPSVVRELGRAADRPTDCALRSVVPPRWPVAFFPPHARRSSQVTCCWARTE